MKKILIYGDSNVWGDNFTEGKRIPDNRQWPNILKEKLKKEFQIYQEGLPGRLAGSNEKEKKYKNGQDTFISTFRTQAPLDYIIIMLGTNDLQIKYNKTAKTIIKDLLWYEDCLKNQFEDLDDQKKYFNNKMPEILYILPANFNEPLIFNEKSQKARTKIIDYFESSDKNYIKLENMPLFEDGIHLNYEGHEIVARKVIEVLEKWTN